MIDRAAALWRESVVRKTARRGCLEGGRMNISILLVDDFPLICEGFAAALGSDPGLNIVGQADNGDEGLRLARELRPDVVILDLNMPGMGGMTVLENLRTDAPEAK